MLLDSEYEELRRHVIERQPPLFPPLYESVVNENSHYEEPFVT